VAAAAADDGDDDDDDYHCQRVEMTETGETGTASLPARDVPSSSHASSSATSRWPPAAGSAAEIIVVNVFKHKSFSSFFIRPSFVGLQLKK